jgi:peptide/nickel transport system permease protein
LWHEKTLDFIKRRILSSIAAFLIVINLNFLLPRLLPGNSADIFASSYRLPQLAVQQITIRLGLNQPWPVQYLLYLKGIFLSWPPFFGVSYQYYPTQVTSLIAYRLGWTLLLLISSFFLAFYISYFLVGLTSTKRGGKLEQISMYSSIFFWSTPAFWVALVLVWIFGVYLHWLPVFGNIDVNVTSPLGIAYSVIVHAILPLVTLTAVVYGQNFVILRGAAQQILKSDYVLAAKARGLKERVISFKYVLRNSLLPLISLLGYSISGLISAIIFVEFVFGYQGIGDLLVDGIVNRDYPVLEGTFFYITLLVIVMAFIGDVIMLRIDPRLKVGDI